jgi:CHAD domain-containing protein
MMVYRTLDPIAAYSLDLIETIMVEGCAALTSSDSEHVHEFRVAIRKSRVLLKALPPQTAFSQELLAVKQCFAKAGLISTPLRDDDVMLDSLAKASGYDPGLEHFLRWLRKRRVRHQAVFRAQVGSTFFQDSVEKWRIVVLSGNAVWPPIAWEQVGVASLATLVKHCRKNWKRYNLDAWHALRKQAKTVRYLLSIPGCGKPDRWHGDSLGELIDLLTDMQRALGGSNDIAVRDATVRRYLKSPTHQGPNFRTTRKQLRILRASDRLGQEVAIQQAGEVVQRIVGWADSQRSIGTGMPDESIKEGDGADSGLL